MKVDAIYEGGGKTTSSLTAGWNSFTFKGLQRKPNKNGEGYLVLEAEKDGNPYLFYITRDKVWPDDNSDAISRKEENMYKRALAIVEALGNRSMSSEDWANLFGGAEVTIDQVVEALFETDFLVDITSTSIGMPIEVLLEWPYKAKADGKCYLELARYSSKQFPFIRAPFAENSKDIPKFLRTERPKSATATPEAELVTEKASNDLPF